MAKISRQVREIINIVLFFVIVGVVLTAYVIYPLNRTKNTMGRVDIGEYKTDSLPVNDPAVFVEAGLATDTFSLDIDINTTLACLYIKPADSALETPRGTVFLLNDQRKDRNSLLSLARSFTDSGYAVVAYDQRASGLSSGKYHGEGFYEANDLEEIIPYLVLRERIYPPVAVVGFSLGADAALL
ncbi:MAG: alpha/beta hydrolase, partial [candidate division Zixibacteria bacterium]|nr:alpha/beta hydrolase [candidate division Zixibacteria bacterium]